MKPFGKRTQVHDRTVQLRTFPGNDEPINEVVPVSELLIRDSLFRPLDWVGNHLPAVEEINRFLLSGSDDNGHFVHRWQPFEISSEDYNYVAEQLRKAQAERVGGR